MKWHLRATFRVSVEIFRSNSCPRLSLLRRFCEEALLSHFPSPFSFPRHVLQVAFGVNEGEIHSNAKDYLRYQSALENRMHYPQIHLRILLWRM